MRGVYFSVLPPCHQQCQSARRHKELLHSNVPPPPKMSLLINMNMTPVMSSQVGKESHRRRCTLARYPGEQYNSERIHVQVSVGHNSEELMAPQQAPPLKGTRMDRYTNTSRQYVQYFLSSGACNFFLFLWSNTLTMWLTPMQ